MPGVRVWPAQRPFWCDHLRSLRQLVDRPASCHCGACHRTFTGVYAFDMHRAGSHAKSTRHCVDPATVGLVPADKPWPGWSRPGTWRGPHRWRRRLTPANPFHYLHRSVLTCDYPECSTPALPEPANLCRLAPRLPSEMGELRLTCSRCGCARRQSIPRPGRTCTPTAQGSPWSAQGVGDGPSRGAPRSTCVGVGVIDGL